MPGMHEIEYKIIGEDLQYVEVELESIRTRPPSRKPAA